MADLIKRALTRHRRRRGASAVVEEPDERLVLGVKFAIGMTAFMSALELAHLAILHTWNAEIFASITGLSGTVVGLFVGQKT
jgi:hypothetical protein